MIYKYSLFIRHISVTILFPGPAVPFYNFVKISNLSVSDLDLLRWFDIVLNLRSDDIFGSFSDTSTLMQCRIDLAMWENGGASHDRSDGVCVQDSLARSWQKVCCFAALEILVQVDQEGEERALLFLGGRVVVYVCIVLSYTARGPRAVDVCSVLCSWDTVVC